MDVCHVDFCVDVIGAPAISAMAAKSSISTKMESTGSEGGYERLSTSNVSSRKSLGVTSPYVVKRWIRVSGMLWLSLFVPGVRNARSYFGSMATTIC